VKITIELDTRDGDDVSALLKRLNKVAPAPALPAPEKLPKRLPDAPRRP
jgi:hypothetical protein